MTVAQALELALQHHQAGRLAEAEALYRQILAVEPGHADALHLLGVVAHQVGRHDVAVELIREAIRLLPTAPAFFSNLGGAYEKLGRHEEAVTAFRRAIELNPDYPEAHNNLGNVLRIQRQTGEAVAAFRRAIQLRPDYAEALSNLGNALTDQGDLDDAIDAFRQAIQLRPELPEAFSNLGAALRERGDLDDALICLRRALELNPDLPATLNNLSVVFKDLGRDEEAVAACHRALQLRPDYASAYNNLGLALANQGRLDEAVAAYGRAIQLQPDLSGVHSNLGKALADQGRITEAVTALRTSLGRTPGSAEAHSNLLLALHYASDADPHSLAAEHRRWDEIHAKPLAGLIGVHGNTRDPERRLRVGYVSPDFREHAVAFFIEGLLATHDREKVEVFCYADSIREDGFTARFRGSAAHWRQITGKSDSQVAEMIRGDGIDVLVDLAGHSAGNRLLVFARKPAPVQVTYLGYPDTTGMASMDFRLTDEHADPAGMTEPLHREDLVRLPDTAWCYRPATDAPLVGELPAIHAGHITFGSFNAMAKITGEMLALWARLLGKVPGARMRLKNAALGERSVRDRVLGVFAKEGIGPERVDLLVRTRTVAEHLGAYGAVDIALDTHPYHGTATTCEALWMGVPVVTLAGRTHVSRVGVSLLENAGLPELIAADAEAYLEIAANLAGDIPRLSALRATLRERMRGSLLTDGVRFARNAEGAYRKMWRAWCAKPCTGPG